MSAPVFSVDCCLLCVVPCHANWLQMSSYDVNPVQSRPSSSSSSAWVHLWLALVSCRFPCSVHGARKKNFHVAECWLVGVCMHRTMMQWFHWWKKWTKSHLADSHLQSQFSTGTPSHSTGVCVCVLKRHMLYEIVQFWLLTIHSITVCNELNSSCCCGFLNQLSH